jgi:KTSC domain
LPNGKKNGHKEAQNSQKPRRIIMKTEFFSSLELLVLLCGHSLLFYPNTCTDIPFYVQSALRGFRAMVFCRECNRKVDDCAHFVAPLGIPTVPVFDPKIKAVAYKTDSRTLEIAFKNGQVWQLADVPPDICETLLQQTLSAFLRFIAHGYKASPVRVRPQAH